MSTIYMRTTIQFDSAEEINVGDLKLLYTRDKSVPAIPVGSKITYDDGSVYTGGNALSGSVVSASAEGYIVITGAYVSDIVSSFVATVDIYKTYNEKSLIEGFLKGDNVLWGDLVMPSTGAEKQNSPTLVTYRGLTGYSLADTPDQGLFFQQELPHSYKEGTDLKVHLHLITNGTYDPTVTTGGQIILDVVANAVAVNGTIPDPAVTGSSVTGLTVGRVGSDCEISAINTHKAYTVAITLDGTNLNISSHVGITVTCTGGNANGQANIILLGANIHHQKDSGGSVNETSKL